MMCFQGLKTFFARSAADEIASNSLATMSASCEDMRAALETIKVRIDSMETRAMRNVKIIDSGRNKIGSSIQYIYIYIYIYIY
jgi:hypothetical protein